MGTYDTTVNVLINTEVDENRITEATQKVEELRSSLDACREAARANGDTESENMFSNMSSSFSDLSMVLSTFKSDFGKFSSVFSGNITKTFNNVNNSLNGFVTSVTKAVKTLGKTGTFDKAAVSDLLEKSLTFSEAGNMLSRVASVSSKDLGWSKDAFASKMPVLMAKLINPEIKRLSETQFIHSTPSLNRYVNSLMANEAVRTGLDKISGIKMSDEQARANFELALLTQSRRAAQSFGANAIAKTPFQKASATLYPHDIIPEQFRAAYYGMGHSKQESALSGRKAFIDQLSTQGSNYVSGSTYKQLRNYVNSQENGWALHDILKEAGIMTIQDGQRHWAKNLTLAQASLLGGLSARELYNAKRGYAFYDANPNDPASDSRVDHRMSRRVQAQLALMDILSQDNRIVPYDNYDLREIEKLNSSYVVRPGKQKGEYIPGTRITNTGTPDQFIMPITEVDQKSGKLIYRDHNWQKKTSLFDEAEDDQFAIMTDNPLVELARQIGYTGKKTKRAYGYGNGTFGYGRDETGKAIYDTPPIIKLNASQFYDTDATGFNQTLNPERGKILRSIVSGKSYNYGDSSYEYAYQGDNAIYMIESGLKQKINEWYDSKNLPSFFQGLNEGGLESIPEYDKLIKQINGMKKGSSTAQAYEDVFGELKGSGPNGSINTRIANLTSWFKALGFKDVDIPDGAAFGDSSVFKNGPLQMRSAVGFGKYVLNTYNLSKLFGMATREIPKDEFKKIGESYGNNWLFSRSGNKGIDVWMPSITATEEDVRTLMTGKRRDDESGNLVDVSPEDLRQLRESKFFIANAGNIDQILTDKTAKQYQAFRYLSGTHYAKQYLGGDTSKLSELGTIFDVGSGTHKRRYDPDKDLVTLTPAEQGEMHTRATPSYMVMRSAWDYASDPSLMSQQTAAAMGFDEELMKQSDAEFERRIFRLGTAEGRLETLKANPFYARRLDQDKSFAYSPEANGYIEKQIRALEEAQLAGYVALPKSVKAFNQVAAITPGAIIEPILRAAGIKDENVINQGLKMLLPSQMDANGMIYTGSQIGQGEQAIVRRNPDAAGQGVLVGSYFHNDDVRAVMKKLGVSDDMAGKAMWLSQRQMNALNTGDFDGDTINAYVGLSAQTLERNAKITEMIKAEQRKYDEAQKLRSTEPAKREQVDVAQARIDALTRYYASTQTMGGASKILREAMNLPDSDQTKWTRVFEGMKLYDFASSEMRTKGLDPVISDLGLETIKGGNSFERFLANMRKQTGKEDEDIRKAHLGRDIFKTNLPSFNDPQGIVSRILAGNSILAGQSDYSNFSASLQKLMDMEYGDSKTPEAEAARWYAKQYEKTAYGRLLTQKDLARGDNLAYNWLRSMNSRGVKQDDEEFLQYSRFQKRLDFLNSGNAATYDALSERSAELQAEYQRTGSEETKARWGLIQKALLNHENFESDFAALEGVENDALWKSAARAARDAKAISEAVKIEEAREEESAKSGSSWNNPSVAGNWSNFKNWIKEPIQLRDVKQLSSGGTPVGVPTDQAISFYTNPADRVAVASRELFDDQFETEHILIGNIMHKSFEDYFKAVGTGNLNGRTIDDFFTSLVTGDEEYARKLKEKGYTIQKTSAEGQPDRYEARGVSGTGLEKLNNLLPTNLNKGVSSLADFIVALDKAGFDTERPANIEGGFVKYDKNGNYEGFDDSGKYEMKMRVPVRNASGEIQKDENGNIIYDETKTTHARPDLMLRKKDSNDLYVVDYKSRYEGAVESLVQSAFYTSVIDRLAKRAWTGKDENGAELEAAEIESIKAFKQAGHLDSNGNYVSDIKGSVGFDPRTRRSVMIERTGENAKWFDEGVKLAEEAMSYKMLDASGLLAGGSAYARAIVDHARINKQVEDRIEHIAGNYNTGNSRETRMSNAEREFFLSRYQADRDTIGNIRSSIYKEMDMPERSYNRFSGYERRLRDALPDDVVKAVMASYSDETGFIDTNSPVIRQLSDEMKDKARMLGQIQTLGMEAAVKDWDKLGEDVPRLLIGAKNTEASSMLENINKRVRQASSSREFLQTRLVTDTDGTEHAIFKNYQKDERGNWNLLTSFLSPQQQADLFATDSENAAVKEAATKAKEKYEESLKAEELAMESVGIAFQNYRAKDSKQQDSDWKKLTGEVKDPVEALQDGLKSRIDAAQSKIDQWNADIVEWTSKIAKGDVDANVLPQVEEFITDRQNRVANAQNDLKTGKINNSYIKEQRRALGLTGAKTAEERAREWYDSRAAVIQAQIDYDYDLAYKKAFSENGFDPAAYAEAMRYRDIANNAYAQPEFQKIKKQSELLQEIWKDQESRPYDDFIKKADGKQYSRDELINRQISDMMAYATNQAISANNTDEQKERWNKLLSDESFWEDQRRRAGERYDEQETINAQRMNDRYANEMLRQRQLGRSRFPGQRGLAGRAMSLRDSWESQARNNRAQLQQELKATQDEYKRYTDNKGNLRSDLSDQEKIRAGDLSKQINGYSEALSKAQQEEQKFANGGGMIAASMNVAGDAISRLMQRLGRQLFQKALQETKRFVKEFDASMTEIQAITLKSDSEMAVTRSQTIDKALRMRTSVSNVSSTEAALYRQGLSDSEVAARTDSIIKFATVAKIKTEEATKIITTALQNNLVSSANEAMDALVALGDNAATTAAEIGKGMQKSAASAKVAGVSYAELTAMLTVGTSSTQLSGTQIGTALNTVFSRMRKMTSDQYSKKEATDAEEALALAGVELWDDKTLGKMRSAYDILSDLSKVWSNLSDAQKSVITNSMAGVRATNIFSTLMEGMSADDGAKMDELLGLAENSAGITQSKYEIAMESLDASIKTVQASFDAIVESFTSNGFITDALDSVAGFLQGIANLGENGGAITGVITAIAAAIGAVGAAALAASIGLGAVAGPLMIVGALLAGGIALGGTSLVSGLLHTEDESVRVRREAAEELASNNAQKANNDTRISQQETAINNVEKLGHAWEDATAGFEKGKAADELRDALLDLSNAFPDLSSSVRDSLDDLSNWTKTVGEAKDAAKNFKQEANQQTADNAVRYIRNNANKLFQADLNESDIISKEEYAKSIWLLDLARSDGYSNYLFNEDGTINMDLIKGAYTDKDSARMIAKLADTAAGDKRFSKVFETTAKRLFPDNYKDVVDQDYRNSDLDEDTLRGMVVQVVEAMALGSAREDNYDARVEQFAKRYATDLFDVSGLSMMANDQYDQAAIREAFTNYIVKNFDQFYHDNQFDGNALANQVSEWLNSYITQGDEFTSKLVEANVDEDYWKYSFSTFKTPQGYYIDDKGNVVDSSTNKINKALTEEKKNSTKHYSTFDQAREAILEYNRIHPFAPIAATDLEGYTGAESAAGAMIQAANLNNERTQIADFINRLNNAESFEGLYSSFDQQLDQEGIANLLGLSPELLGAYNAAVASGDFESFKSFANKYGVNGFKSSDLAQWAAEGLEAGTISAEALAGGDENYGAAYKAFSKFYGDLADSILEAYADATSEMPAELTQAMNKVEFANKLKEQFSYLDNFSTFSDYAVKALYGTAGEKTSMYSGIGEDAAALGAYNEAVNRILNGTAKQEDYAAVAGRSRYTEIQLKNGSFDAEALTSERNNAISERLEILNNMVASMWEDEGMTEERIAEIIGYLPSDYKYDAETRRFSYNGSEQKLTARTIRQNYLTNLKDSNTASIFKRLSTATSDAYVSSILSGEDYQKLLDNPLYAAYANAGVGREDFQAMLRRGAQGRTGTYAEAYGPLMQALFGSTNVREWNFENAAKLYSSSPEMQSAFETFFSGTAGGDQLREYMLNGGELQAGVLEGVMAQLAGNLSGLNFSRIYTDSERNRLAQKLLADGRNWNDLRRDTSLGLTVDDWAAVQQVPGLVDYLSMSQEQRQSREGVDLANSLRLSDLKASGDVFGYAREQYRQSNKGGLAANAIFETLSNADVKSVDDLIGVLDDKRNAQNWKDLLESSPELAKKMSDMGLSMDENGNWDTSGLISSSDDAASALSYLAGAVRDATEAYTHEDVQTTGENYKQAIDYLNGNVLDEPKQFEAMRSIFGDAFANEVGSAYQEWSKGRDARAQWEQDLAEARKTGDRVAEESLLAQPVADVGKFVWGANMSEYDRDLAQILVDRAPYGQYGLSDLDRYNEMNRLFEAANSMNGISTLRNSDSLGLYGQLVTGAEGFDQWARGVEALNDAGIALKDFNAESKQCQEALSKAGIAVNSFAENNKRMGSELRAVEVETKKLYGENSTDIANRIRQLSKGEKERAQALKEITANYDKLNQTAYTRSQWNSGKKNYKDVASAIGQSEAYVKDMVARGKGDEITKQLDIQFEVDQQQCLNDAQAEIDTALAGFEGDDINKFQEFLIQMGINGEFDASNLEAVASQAQGVVAQIINNLIAYMASMNGSVTFGVDMDGQTASVKAKNVRLGGKGGGGYRGGGGGGGGGEKSAAQQLLDRQKREVARYQHELKMMEIQETHYDRTNEYADYMNLLDQEIAKQRELQGVYAGNVAELQAMLSGMSEADDDYDKVADALYQAEEALAEINNTIDEINAKRIKIVSEKQEIEDKPQTHKLTQIGNLATRYMDAKEYDNYYKASQMQIDATREQIRQNEGQIAEWENMLWQFQEGSDDWIEIRDKIWAMREENASLENQALEQVIQLNQQKISQISEELEHGQQFSNHLINMNSTYGDMYNSNGQYQDYRNTLTQQNTGYETNISTYQTAISNLLTLMATLDKTSDEWFSARDAVFQYEEAIAQAKSAILENNQAIQESRVSELTTNYDHMTSDMQHELKILQNQKQIYDDDNDYEAYVEMLRKEEQATTEMVAAMKYSLTEMESEIGNIDQDSDAWWNLHDKILSVREAISDAEVSLENFENQITQSKIDHLIEKFGYIDEMDQHNLKLIQYQETRYQNAGELTNYGTMLGIENEYQQKYADDLADHIRLLKDERENVEVGSDAYYKLEQTIAKYEEQLEATNNTIAKNTKLMEENQEKIRQTVMNVENLIDQEYRARIQKTRDMLAAEVNMQNTILDTIKKRYQEEFALEQKRIAKLKESLNQEKSLINERLNARKNAADQADQYEELAEYKRQLALLSADPTRTKEAKELQKRIADMEKDMAYQTASAEASSEGERIDDQLKAYDDYLANAQEDLNMMLADSNAVMAAAQADFGYNVSELMAGSWTDLLAWLQENNVSYRNATEELQTQMVNGWEDTWKKMWGIIDTYWDEIHVIMADATTFMDYMKESDTYASRSETGQASLEYTWGDKYADMIAATIDNASYDHEHEWITDLESKIDEARNWTYKVELAGKERDLIGAFGLSDYLNYGIDHVPVDVSDIFWDDLYTGVGKVIEQFVYTGGGGGGGGHAAAKPTPRKVKDKYYVDDPRTAEQREFSSLEEAQRYANSIGDGVVLDKDLNEVNYNAVAGNSKTNNKSGNSSSTSKSNVSINSTSNVQQVVEQNKRVVSNAATSSSAVSAAATNILNMVADKFKSMIGTKNAEGGVVDYTGLAWVDGSLSRPESFLDAEDTKNIAALTNALNYVSVPTMRTPNLSDYAVNNTSVGDIVINITQADLGSDADIEEVAKKVGRAFSKQLSKQGLNLTSVSF